MDRSNNRLSAPPSLQPGILREALRWSCLCLALMLVTTPTIGRSQAKVQTRKKKRPQPFRWVNPLKESLAGVQHAVFTSPSMGREVGYCIYLPPAYHNDPDRRFPVVYYLHGGRPGSEIKSVRLARYFHRHISAGDVAPMLYVFVNGGPVSHYNLPDREQAMGEDVFVKELIPHIDATYRTLAERRSRGIEGFSQGGRGTARIMFRYPDRFSSAAPGGAGQATEKRISEENGRESPTLQLTPGDNTWDLARQYAAHPQTHPDPPLKILIHVGTKGFNYQNNLEYMEFLESQGIPFSRLIVDGAGHSAQQIYAERGLEIMRFHADNFRRKPTGN